jgi:hypothetical protein
MLIIALVLAVIGLAALVFAVVTSNEVVAWVCIGASVLGVVLLIIDALRERQRRGAGTSAAPADHELGGEPAAEHPEEIVEHSDETSSHPEPTAEASETPAVDSVSSDDHNTR